MRRRAQTRRVAVFVLGGVSLALVAFMAFTCQGAEVQACPTPVSGSQAATDLGRARAEAGFTLLYPCYLPNSQRLESASVTGNAGRRRAELIFAGPFELAVRQSQFPPPLNPDPAGASRSEVDLFPNVRAILIEINDGSSRATYHLFWERGGIHYEVQAAGPPLQRRSILQIATSLQ
jgi:hypothetical protein